MSHIPSLKLNDGAVMPQFGLGVWQVSDKEAIPAIHQALAAGYRSIDTASAYDNEESVGEALRTASVPRSELFITTKLWNDSHGRDSAIHGLEHSLKRLKLDHVNLFLIHWPVPRLDKYVETWRAFIKLKQEGLTRSIGVSNFPIRHLQRLIEETGVVPAVNQVELHPLFQQSALRIYHSVRGIVTESWSPLGRGQLLKNPELLAIAEKHGKSVAQVILRWHIQSGLVVIPKSVTPQRIYENAAIFDFQLDTDDMARIIALDSHHRIGPDPETFALM
jgi:2,5-diketo-D-gluconate reductase A